MAAKTRPPPTAGDPVIVDPTSVDPLPLNVRFQFCAPVSALYDATMPPPVPMYRQPSAMIGVFENVEPSILYASCKFATFEGPMVVSLGWLREFPRSWP